MGMPIQGSVGPQGTSSGDGAQLILRTGRTGEQIIQQLHARYFEQTYRGGMYSAANQAAQAVSVALATTYTGIGLYNPPGSGVNLVPNKVKFALSVAPAAIATIGLISCFSPTGAVTTQTTVLAARGNMLGAAAGKGIALAAATIATPVWHMALLDGFTAAALPNPSVPIDLDGAIIIPPGGFLGIGALTAVTGLGSIFWEEVLL